MYQSGDTVLHENLDGIRKASIVFHSDEAEERYQRIMDEIGNLVGRVNRLACEMDTDGFPLPTDAGEEFVCTPLSDIQHLTMKVLHPDAHPAERREAIDALLRRYADFVAGLDAVLRTGSDPNVQI